MSEMTDKGAPSYAARPCDASSAPVLDGLGAGRGRETQVCGLRTWTGLTARTHGVGC